jgi:signal recognition particle GTPase
MTCCSCSMPRPDRTPSSRRKQFSDAVEVTGLVVTKLDGTAKGGVVIGISSELSLPVKYIGVGEQIDDLQVFDDESFVQALFGSLRTEDDVTVEE